MSDQHFLSPADSADTFRPRPGGERVMWRGRCGVAEYAFEHAASLPRWTLPETTDVLVTDHRVLYAYPADDGLHIRSGELRWLWPQHLRVQPGRVSTDRGAAATQIQLVCGGADGTYPALVFAGGDLTTVAAADRMANVMRQAIARFRVDNAEKLGLSTGEARMLSRMLIGPEFRNHQGGDGQTVSLLGALPVSRPAPAAMPLDEATRSFGERTRLITYRPGLAADAARALMAAKAEQATQQTEPAIASRAADLAARVADMVTHAAEPEPAPDDVETWDFTPSTWRPAAGRPEARPRHSEPRFTKARMEETVPLDAPTTNLDAPTRSLDAPTTNLDMPTTNLTERAEAIRRTAARMASNAARTRIVARRSGQGSGTTPRGKHGP